MKNTVLIILKFFLSSFLALIILSTLCLVYYNPPIAVPQPNKYTNHRFVENSYWVNMTEGYGYGRINNIGYSDKNDYDASLPTIAFLGSSQVQAMQVGQNNTFVSLVGDLLKNDADPSNDYQCANLGVAGHYFNISASNFEYFIDAFENVDYVVVEVSLIDYSDEQLDTIMAGGFHSDLANRGTLYNLLQRIPYIRLIAKQMQDLKGADTTNNSDGITDYDSYKEKTNAIIKKMADTAAQHDVQLIFMYHYPQQINPDNTIQAGNDVKAEQCFTECCNENNVPLINMNQPMIDHFNETYEPSYGFSNSTLGVGHLNNVGHRLVAQEIYAELLRQMEEK